LVVIEFLLSKSGITDPFDGSMPKRKENMQIKKAARPEPPFSHIFPVLQQRVDHADQHADNEQGRGIESETVHGVLSFAFLFDDC